jgi:acyl dehydratase
MNDITDLINDPTHGWLENHPYDSIVVGQVARLVRTLTLADIQAFAAVSGDTNPAHLDPTYANATLFDGVIGHSMWGGSLISTVLGTVFPGPGTLYLQQNLHFSRPVRIGDTLNVTVTCMSKQDDKKIGRARLFVGEPKRRARAVRRGQSDGPHRKAAHAAHSCAAHQPV